MCQRCDQLDLTANLFADRSAQLVDHLREIVQVADAHNLGTEARLDNIASIARLALNETHVDRLQLTCT